jgi:hypothetical protein
MLSIHSLIDSSIYLFALSIEPISKRSKPALKKRPDVELIATIS